MNQIEKELCEATDFKPLKQYDKKQDYLAALARMVDQLNDKDFNRLSKEAADWANAAARAISNKKVIPDFDEKVATSEVEIPEEPDIQPRTEELPKVKRPYHKTAQPPLIIPIPEVDETFGKLDQNVMDKFGFVVGTKNSKAMAMFEAGARMKDVKASLGGTYYAALGRVIKRGHKVIHGANDVITLTYNGRASKT